MSKKSAFSHQKETQEKNEFEEKDEEEENEEEERNADNSNNNKTKNIKAKESQKEENIQDDPLDYSDDEDEVGDKISDLNAIPNFFEIPKPVNLFKPPLPPGSSMSEKSFIKKICSTRLENCLPHHIQYL